MMACVGSRLFKRLLITTVPWLVLKIWMISEERKAKKKKV